MVDCRNRELKTLLSVVTDSSWPYAVKNMRAESNNKG